MGRATLESMPFTKAERGAAVKVHCPPMGIMVEQGNMTEGGGAPIRTKYKRFDNFDQDSLKF